MLAESAGGDIRASINALQFSCLQDASTNSYSEIFQVRGLGLVRRKITKCRYLKRIEL
jgi:hypothetical protein